MSRLGDLIRGHREMSLPIGAGSLRQPHLSQNGLARMVGVAPAYVFRIERGDRIVPSRVVILRLAEALDLGPVDTDELLIAAGHCPALIASLDDDRRHALLTLLAR